MLWDHGFPQKFLINSTQVPQNFHSINHHKIIHKPVNSTVFPQFGSTLFPQNFQTKR